jgi:hypothetical protein
MSAVLELLPIDGQPVDVASTAVAVAPTSDAAALTIKQTVLALFQQSRPVLERLVARHTDVEFDLKTPKGLADAKAARHDLRENGRFAVQRTQDAMKKAVNALKPVIDAEAEKLIAITKPLEDQLHTAISDREDEIEAERAEAARIAAEAAAERRRIEEERVAKHEAGLTRIRNYLEAAKGLPSARITAGMAVIEAIKIGPEWEEYQQRAQDTLDGIIARMRVLRDQTKLAEDEAAERERQRAENERRAAELAKQERQLAARRAEIERMEAEARERTAALTKASAPAPDLPPSEDKAEIPKEALAPAPLCETTVAAPPAIDGLTVTEVESESIAPAPAPSVEPEIVATINTGEVSRRLGFIVTADFIETTLGITRHDKVKAATLWRESAWPAIKEALIEHIQGLA